MRLDRRYKPWVMASEDRENLGYVLVERTSEHAGVMVAADGYIMGVFPVELDPGEEVGTVKAAHVRYACEASQRSWCRFTLDSQLVTMPDGSMHPRDAIADWPDWHRVADAAITFEGAEPRLYIALWPALLCRLMDGLGIGEYIGARFWFTGPATELKPVVVMPVAAGRPWSASIEPPYAIVMPMRVLDGET